MRQRLFLLAAASLAPLMPFAWDCASAKEAEAPADAGEASSEDQSDVIIVTARRTAQDVRDVPIPVSVFNAEELDRTSTFNINRLRELIPTLQFNSSNPRNTAVNIRGLGAPFGLTNDGIDPGVGIYVDGVFYARPASASFDFVDIERLEVLRGPQGTLFGRTTTAGAINITTQDPSFEHEGRAEATYGNYGFIQGKATIAGPIWGDKLAGRLSFSGTQRDGVITNVALQDDVNDFNNLGLRGKILFEPNAQWKIVLAGDFNRQRAECCTQVVAGIAPTLRPDSRQFAGIAAALNYSPPSLNAFDRRTDIDSPLFARQDLGGASLTIERSFGEGVLTSVSAWRYWNWDPSNDRDFIGLPVTRVSANPSQQRQWSQELRYAGSLTRRVDAVGGVFFFRQTVESQGAQEQGAAASRFLLAPSALATPALLDGLRQESDTQLDNLSAAIFGQLEWRVTDRLRLLPGVRFNYDRKQADVAQTISGGLSPATPAQRALQNSILSAQSFSVDAGDFNVSGQITASYEATKDIHLFATYARSFKPVGVNLGGLPLNAAGLPAVEIATIAPEDVRHLEVGLKSRLPGAVSLDLTVFRTNTQDYQTQVVNDTVGVLRGFLANADEVRAQGVEAEARKSFGNWLSLYGSAAFTDARYISFPDAPSPLELTGGPSVVDASGGRLPGVSRWAASLGGEIRQPVTFSRREVIAYFGVDTSYRSVFSSSPTPSRFLNVDGYTLLNLRAGLRASNGVEIFGWVRNATQTEYFDFLSAAPGGSGLFVGQVGDPRTFGLTIRGAF